MLSFTMGTIEAMGLELLRLTLVPGLGPVLINRLMQQFGSCEAVIAASATALANVRGIGMEKARGIVAAMPGTLERAKRELEEAARLGVRLVSAFDDEYPELLRQIPDPPPILSVRGRLAPRDADRYPVAIVGSRSCSQYGREQADRFGAALAEAGLTVISGGARGIDTVAHRAALRSKGRTVAVLGCGLGHVYPPDNRELFDQISGHGGSDGNGAVVSELPLNAPPSAENFPARNRIIAGMSLGVVVVEAGRRSGALITARAANEDHGREVFAIPGRVDAAASEGTLELIKEGGAALVTSPRDVIEALEARARHQFDGSHGAVTANPAREPGFGFRLFSNKGHAEPIAGAKVSEITLSPMQLTIISALDEPATVDELIRKTGLDAAKVMSEVTLLEIRRQVVRTGQRLSRATR